MKKELLTHFREMSPLDHISSTLGITVIFADYFVNNPTKSIEEGREAVKETLETLFETYSSFVSKEEINDLALKFAYSYDSIVSLKFDHYIRVEAINNAFNTIEDVINLYKKDHPLSRRIKAIKESQKQRT